MRAHAADGGLLEVDVDDRAVGAGPDRDLQVVLDRLLAPVDGRVERGGVVEAQHLRQAGGVRHRRGVLVARLGGAARALERQAPRGQAAGDALGLVVRQAVRAAQDAAAPGLLGADLLGRDVEQLDVRPGLARQVAGEVEDRHPGHAVGGDDAGRVDLPAVEDDHQVPLALAGGRPRRPAGAAGELVAQRGLELAGGVVEHAHRSGAVLFGGVLEVRQPLHPVPLGHALVVGDDGDQDVVGRVEDGELAELGAQVVHDQGPVAAQDHAAGLGVLHRARDVDDVGVRGHEAAQRHRGHRFEVLDRFRLRRHEFHRHALLADAHAHFERVVVLGAALPHAARADQGPQRARVGVAPARRPPLPLGALPGAAADLVEVAHVVAAVGVELGLLLAAVRGDVGGHHADHRDAHHGAHGHHEGVDAAAGAAAAHHHERHGARAAQHGQHHEVLADRLRLRIWHVRRRLEQDVAARSLRTAFTRRPAEQFGRHNGSLYSPGRSRLGDACEPPGGSRRCLRAVIRRCRIKDISALCRVSHCQGRTASPLGAEPGARLSWRGGFILYRSPHSDPTRRFVR